MPVSVPYLFVNSTDADATQVDANFTSVVNVLNNINNTNIGPLGIYASQVVPTNQAQGTFPAVTSGGPYVVTGGVVGIASGVAYSSYGPWQPGDLVATRTTSTGGVQIGGVSSSVQVDYNTTNPNAVTIVGAASGVIVGQSTGGALVSANVAVMMTTGGVNVGGAPKIIVGSITTSGTSTTINFVSGASFGNVYGFQLFDTTGTSYITPSTVAKTSIVFPCATGHNVNYVFTGN